MIGRINGASSPRTKAVRVSEMYSRSFSRPGTFAMAELMALTIRSRKALKVQGSATPDLERKGGGPYRMG